MKKTILYTLLGIMALALIALVVTGRTHKKKLDERLSFRKRDKIPYGTWVAFQSLSKMFPEAVIYNNRREPGLWDLVSEDSTSQLFIAITPRFRPEDYEMRKLISFVENGNDVFVSTREVSSELENLLSCKITDSDLPYYFDINTQVANMDDSLSLSLKKPFFQTGGTYRYPGRKLDATFTKTNTNTTEILGTDGNGNPDFIRLRAGKGNFYLHLAPLGFSNYFLLHKQNISYYEQVLSLISPRTKKILWDEYFIYKQNRDNDHPKKNWLSVLSRFPGLKAALITAFLTLLLYLLLEMRRKQRYIPVVSKPRNDSLDFVKTIGRLYYDRSDHKNLCRKMGTYFLEYVRNRYKLPTGNLDDEFIRQLQFRSGVNETEIKQIVSYIKYSEDAPVITARDLSEFHQQLESFYKKA